MSELVVNVHLWDKPVGALSWDASRGIAYFEYEPNFVRNPLPVSPIKMPVTKGVYSFAENRNNCFRGLPGFIADSLPDKFGDQIISEWFQTMGHPLETVTPLERLCYVGKRSMGALEFEPSLSTPGLDKSTEILVDDLVMLAESVFRDREKFREKLVQQDKTLYDILRVGTSAGGAKPKAIIAYNESTGEVRSGQVTAPKGFGYWLLKFDDIKNNKDKDAEPDGGEYTKIEFAYYLMAREAGIRMTDCRLYQENGRAHFMTKRFDRIGNKGEKLHMQSLCAMAHMDFNTPRVYSYEDAFRVMRELQLPYQDFLQLLKRMIFNEYAKNFDDHTKNIAFLMDKKGVWSLAPAFDMTFSYRKDSVWVSEHQMLINGKSGEITKEDFLTVAKMAGIKKNDAAECEEAVRDAVSKWAAFAEASGLSKEKTDRIRKQ